jgi:hypothetical protein
MIQFKTPSGIEMVHTEEIMSDMHKIPLLKATLSLPLSI